MGDNFYSDFTAFALNCDGYRTSGLLYPDSPTPSEEMDYFEENFDIQNDPIYNRCLIFFLQRFFGKWGGEQLPEWDRSYSMYYLLYLAAYREPFPSELQDKRIKPLSFERRESVAAHIRRHFTAPYPPISTDFKTEINDLFFLAAQEQKEYLQERHLLEKPEVLLAFCWNAPLIAQKRFERTPSQEDGQNLKKAIEETIKTMTDSLEFYEDDLLNAVCMNLIQLHLARCPEKANFQTAEHALLEFLYLQYYRKEPTEPFQNPVFFPLWRQMPDDLKESTARRFRQNLSTTREDYFQKRDEGRGRG